MRTLRELMVLRSGLNNQKSSLLCADWCLVVPYFTMDWFRLFVALFGLLLLFFWVMVVFYAYH